MKCVMGNVTDDGGRRLTQKLNLVVTKITLEFTWIIINIMKKEICSVDTQNK